MLVRKDAGLWLSREKAVCHARWLISAAARLGLGLVIIRVSWRLWLPYVKVFARKFAFGAGRSRGLNGVS